MATKTENKSENKTDAPIVNGKTGEVEKTPNPPVALTEFVPLAGAIMLSDGQERRYWHVEPGNVIRGFIVDYVTLTGEEVPADFDDSNEDRRFFVVELDAPAAFRISGSEITETAVKGDLLYVGIRHGLKSLIKFAGSDVIPMVQIQATGKKALDKSRSVWRFAIQVAPTKRRKIPLSKTVGTASGATDGDMPF